jgi:tRNA pseudouridine38-40 synthase
VPLYRVTLAYDGTDFLGWQLQRPGAGRTVQGVLEEALGRLAGGERVAVAGAGRTDAGVHALGQVAAFELPRDLPPGELRRALNGLLPADIRALDAVPAPPGFQPRRSAVSKLYRYELDCGGVLLPQRRRFAGFVPWPLDEAAVRAAAALYLGRRDFASLASAGGSVKTTVRTVTRSAAAFEGTTLVYEAEADGFLRKMVRSMVGGLIAVGRGVLRAEALERALEARDRREWPAPAPACGLTLVRVVYPPAPRC